MIVLLDNGHGSSTSGKQSPDGRLREYKWARVMANRIKSALEAKGVTSYLVTPEETDVSLAERCRRVNAICKKHGVKNCILVSIHVDAAGADGQWHNAGGWSAYTTRGTTRSDALAECLYDAAEKHLEEYTVRMLEGKKNGTYSKNQRPIRTDKSDGDRDMEANFYILKNTVCPAVLTENLFQDNRMDVDYLLSEDGMRTLTALHVDGIMKFIGK